MWSTFTFVAHLCSCTGKKYHALFPPPSTIIPCTTVVSLHVVARDIATVKTIRKGVTWRHLLQDEFPYYVSFGKTARASCIACKRVLPRDEMRVRTTLKRYVYKVPLLPSEINFCINITCLRSATSVRNCSLIIPVAIGTI